MIDYQVEKVAYEKGYRANSAGEVISPRGKKLKLQKNNITGKLWFAVTVRRNKQAPVYIDNFVEYQNNKGVVFEEAKTDKEYKDKKTIYIVEISVISKDKALIKDKIDKLINDIELTNNEAYCEEYNCHDLDKRKEKRQKRNAREISKAYKLQQYPVLVVNLADYLNITPTTLRNRLKKMDNFVYKNGVIFENTNTNESS